MSAAQAAWLVDRHERQVRWHIVTRKDLPAVKDGRSWAIDVDALEAIPGWRVNRERLAELQSADARTAASMAARLAELERTVRELRGRLARLEAQSGASGGASGGAAGSSASDAPLTSAPEGSQAGATGVGRYPDISTGAKPSDLLRSAFGEVSPSQHGLSADARHILSSYGPAQPVALADPGAGGPLRFRTKTDAARWLGRHAVSPLTPKSWPGWPPAELTPVATLAFALEVQTAARARGDWRVSWRLARCTDPACVCQSMLEA